VSVLVFTVIPALLTYAQLLPLSDISIYSKFTQCVWYGALLTRPQPLRPMYPGQAPTIRCNLFNIMLVLDLCRPESLYFTANTISMLVDRSYPMRIGFIPIVETEDGVNMARVFYYLTQNYGRIATITFFHSVREPICTGY
jgi:hypothetical protein